MAADASQQETLLDDTGDVVARIETAGGVIRPALALVHGIVSEYRVDVDEDGLHIVARDPANVAIIELDVHAAAFEAYTVETPGTVGVLADTFEAAVGYEADYRDPTDDMQLVFGVDWLSATTHHSLGGTVVTRMVERHQPDPDSIRAGDSIPDLGLPNEVTVSTAAFGAGVTTCDAVANHVDIVMEGEQAVMRSVSDDEVGAARVGFDAPVSADEPAAVSQFSLDYLRDIVRGLRFDYPFENAVDEVVLCWGDNYPITIGFGRLVDGTPAYTGRYGLAPRIREEDK